MLLNIIAIQSWLNSFGVDPAVHDVMEDLKDGTILFQVIEKIQPGIVDWKKVDKTPDNTFRKVENCEYAISLVR